MIRIKHYKHMLLALIGLNLLPCPCLSLSRATLSFKSLPEILVPPKKLKPSAKKVSSGEPQKNRIAATPPSALYQLASSSSDVTNIYLTGTDRDPITNATLNLLTRFSNLTRLTIDGSNITTKISTLSKLHNLAELTLHGNWKLTDNDIKQIAKNCKKLHSFTLSNARITHQSSLRYLPNHLKELDLSNSNVTDKTLKQIVDSCPNLIYLDLGLCNEITEDSLREIARQRRGLITLNLYKCPYVTKEGLKCLISLPKLQELALPNGEWLKGKAVKAYLSSLSEVYGKTLRGSTLRKSAN